MFSAPLSRSAPFSHLLAPGRIGSMELRNRIVMSPMETMYGTPEGHPSERTIAYFARRAAGGVGLITVGATGIDPLHPETPGGLQIGTDVSVAAHRALVEAVHAHGAKIQPQIVHAGPDGLGPELHGVTSLGPSVIASYLTGRPSAEASKEEIAAILDQFRAASARVREAGYDGMELHAAHGYMFLGSFLAPQRNRRGDRYRGTSVEGRIRVVLEALAAIRSEVGTGFPITLRISGYERVAAGRPIHDTATIAPLLVEAGVDAFHVSGGVIDRLVTGMVNGAAADRDDRGDGLNVGAASAVREVVDVPVIAVGRLHDPALAEQVLADGRADFVAMGRPLLADPDLPAKVAAGQATRVRRCISCENCIDTLEEKLATECAINPATGHEMDLGLSDLGGAPGPRRKHVVVVGGGPAGLETARLASAVGHRVTLLEQSSRLGGALVDAVEVHPSNGPYLEWLLAEVAAAEIGGDIDGGDIDGGGVDGGGVEVRTGVRATPGLIADLAPDVVAIAIGGRVDYPAFHGAGGSHVVHGIAPSAPLSGRRVAVIGTRMAAVEYAAVLAARGHLVALLSEEEEIAPEFGPKRRTEEMDLLDRRGVSVHVGCTIEEITDDGVRFVPWHGTSRLLPADTVVLAGQVLPDPGFAEDVRAALADRAAAGQTGAGQTGVPVMTLGDAGGLALIRGASADAARFVASYL